VVELIEDHPAIDSGLQIGDVIVGVNDRDVLTWNDYNLYINTHPDMIQDGFTLRVRRGEEVISINATRREDDQLFGMRVKQEEIPSSFGTVLQYTWNTTSYMFRSVFDSLSMLCRGAASVKDMSGVVGLTNAIVRSTDEVITESTEAGVSVIGPLISLLLTISALLSINLGIMNLLPIPALDGGRIVLSLFEGIFRKKVPTKIEFAINSVGMIFLLGLMVYIVIQDVTKLFS
jgi:regulator of sigma E protease